MISSHLVGCMDPGYFAAPCTTGGYIPQVSVNRGYPLVFGSLPLDLWSFPGGGGIPVSYVYPHPRQDTQYSPLPTRCGSLHCRWYTSCSHTGTLSYYLDVHRLLSQVDPQRVFLLDNIKKKASESYCSARCFLNETI